MCSFAMNHESNQITQIKFEDFNTIEFQRMITEIFVSTKPTKSTKSMCVKINDHYRCN